MSRAKTGGRQGGGLHRLPPDRADLVPPKPLKRQDETFNERISLVFKRLRVVCMVDSTRDTLAHLTDSDRVIEGSPQNSVTAVPVERSTPTPVPSRPRQAEKAQLISLHEERTSGRSSGRRRR